MEKVKKIDLSWIVVSDLKKAIQFFTEKVGLKVNEYDENSGWAELSGHEGGSLLGIAQNNAHSPISPGYNAVMTFTVDNIEKASAEFAKKGGNLIGNVFEIPGVVKMQLFSDADGNKFQLVESIEHS